MKREPLEKPPPLLLPTTKHRGDVYSKHASFKEKVKSAEERAVHKFTARYDAFQGILKRVSEMKLNGSLDSEEPSSGSERSESTKSRQLKERSHFRNSLIENHSNVSAFEDESSCSSITGSDQCPPYEEIPRGAYCSRYSCSRPPSYPAYAESVVSSFRESFPSPPSSTESYESFSSRSASKEYKAQEFKRKDPEKLARPEAVTATTERKASPVHLAADINDNCTKPCEMEYALDESRHPQGISDAEKHQVEMFFRSLKTVVFVCGSLANLYFGWKERDGNWTYKHTGLVVVLFDAGDTRSRNKRKIQILLAERGTCFPLWKDIIDNLSAYRKSGTAFHTMYLSSDHRQTVGLSFDSSVEADALLRHLEELTSNPENINISAPGSRKKKKASPKKKPPPLPHKNYISNPCLFQHLTSVSARDKPIYMSLQTLLDSEVIKKEQNIC